MPKSKKTFLSLVTQAFRILKPETSFYMTVLIYGLAISIINLATPISVQTLVNTIANTALENQVVVLSVVLFGLLSIAGVIYAIQKYTMELFERRFFVRIVSEIVMQIIYANVTHFRNINRAELMNRYFDIMTVQKNLPSILTGGFALLLQLIVGLVLTSFYHPAFLMLNLMFLICIYAVWRIWGHRATKSAVTVSESKYDVAQWLENMANANSDFKAHERIIFALQRAESHSADYIQKRKHFFSLSIKQAVGFLFLYAFFSALLLGVGGILVIRGELSLGQLIAAELILSSIFFGVSRAQNYLTMFYEMIAALDKVSAFYDIELEEDEGRIFSPSECFHISFKDVKIPYRETQIRFNFEIPVGHKVLACSNSHVLQEYFIDLLEGYRFPDRGRILFGNQDITEINPQAFRDKIYVLDETHLLDCTIEQYLKMAAPNANKLQISDMLALMYLTETIEQLPDGLKTKIISSGYPLSKSESLRLKMASALLSKPSVIIISEIFDIVGYHLRQSILKYLHEREDLTVIYFTNRRDLDFFHDYLYLDWNEDSFFDNLDDLKQTIVQNVGSQ